MKIAATTTIVALFVSSVHGFSLTMSSYLEKLGSAKGGLSSFAPSNGASYGATPSYSYGSVPAPASYTTPAPASYSYGSSPAPAPYVSSFANAPVSKSLNYMGSLGGGNAKKWGTDYSGVSSSFRPTQAVGNASYLDNLKGAVMQRSDYSRPAPASYSYQSSWAPAPAAPTASSPSYSYGSSTPAPAPYTSSFAKPSSVSAAKSTSSYLASL
jgi:hypothetical protein